VCYSILFTVPKIHTPKDSKRSLNFYSQDNIELEGNLNSSSDLNDVLPLSQTSVVSLNLDDNTKNEVSNSMTSCT
jgi:hypothetical protein